MNKIKFLSMIFIVGVIILANFSCSKDSVIENRDTNILIHSFQPQCDFSKSIDTTLLFKIAMIAKIISEDSTFNTKIKQFSILNEPTEEKFYEILNFEVFRLTNKEALFLSSLNSLEAESFYKKVEEQFNCLNQSSTFSLELRASLWRTLWRVGSSAAAVGLGCATGVGCVLAGMYAVDQIWDAFCDFHPERC